MAIHRSADYVLRIADSPHYQYRLDTICTESGGEFLCNDTEEWGAFGHGVSRETFRNHGRLLDYKTSSTHSSICIR